MPNKKDRSRDIISRDHKVASPSLTRSFDLVVDRAQGSTIFDVEGNSYIDFASSVAVMNIGYNCKNVKQAVCAQMEKMVHCGYSDFYSDYAYCYRCPLNLEYPGCGISCAKEIERTIFKRELSPKDTAAIVVEPIQGEGGFIVPPPEFHKEIRRICDENDVLMIADEIQSGGFRTGKFMALENFNVRADIVCMSKSIGGGIPLGATLSNSRIMSWPPGTHANTFGGNLLAAAGGFATLEFMESAKLGDKAVEKGNYLIKRLNELKEKYPIIGDVRGIG